MDASCLMCGKAGLFSCAKCSSVAYCSRQCQKRHWKEHKKQCSSIDSDSAITDSPTQSRGASSAPSPVSTISTDKESGSAGRDSGFENTKTKTRTTASSQDGSSVQPKERDHIIRPRERIRWNKSLSPGELESLLQCMRCKKKAYHSRYLRCHHIVCERCLPHLDTLEGNVISNSAREDEVGILFNAPEWMKSYMSESPHFIHRLLGQAFQQPEIIEALQFYDVENESTSSYLVQCAECGTLTALQDGSLLGLPKAFHSDTLHEKHHNYDFGFRLKIECSDPNLPEPVYCDSHPQRIPTAECFTCTPNVLLCNDCLSNHDTGHNLKHIQVHRQQPSYLREERTKCNKCQMGDIVCFCVSCGINICMLCAEYCSTHMLAGTGDQIDPYRKSVWSICQMLEELQRTRGSQFVVLCFQRSREQITALNELMAKRYREDIKMLLDLVDGYPFIQDMMVTVRRILNRHIVLSAYAFKHDVVIVHHCLVAYAMAKFGSAWDLAQSTMPFQRTISLSLLRRMCQSIFQWKVKIEPFGETLDANRIISIKLSVKESPSRVTSVVHFDGFASGEILAMYQIYSTPARHDGNIAGITSTVDGAWVIKQGQPAVYFYKLFSESSIQIDLTDLLHPTSILALDQKTLVIAEEETKTLHWLVLKVDRKIQSYVPMNVAYKPRGLSLMEKHTNVAVAGDDCYIHIYNRDMTETNTVFVTLIPTIAIHLPDFIGIDWVVLGKPLEVANIEGGVQMQTLQYITNGEPRTIRTGLLGDCSLCKLTKDMFLLITEGNNLMHLKRRGKQYETFVPKMDRELQMSAAIHYDAHSGRLYAGDFSELVVYQCLEGMMPFAIVTTFTLNITMGTCEEHGEMVDKHRLEEKRKQQERDQEAFDLSQKRSHQRSIKKEKRPPATLR